jgi:hypothetical protein
MNRAVIILALSTFAARAEAEEILLLCKVRLPNSASIFTTSLEINDQRVLGDGTTLTKNVTIRPENITFKVDSYFLNFISEVKIDRSSGAYTEVRTMRKTSEIANEWTGSCVPREK